MDIKEYLTQAYRIDQRINSKMEQVSSLHALATKATATVSDMPGGGAKNIHKMENIIIKIADLENEINEDIDELVDLKIAITKLIKSVDNQEHQTLLELRYLCFKTWEQIAVDMGYKVRHLYRLHEEALKNISNREDVEARA